MYPAIAAGGLLLYVPLKHINLGGSIATNENTRITIMMIVSYIGTMYVTH